MIIRKKQLKQELVQYLYAACMSPTPSTFIKAIKNNHFILWLGLTPDLIAKHLLKSIPTIQGHLKTEHQGLQSTKIIPISKKELDELDKDYFPTPDSPNLQSNQVCYALIQPDEISIGFLDLTGWFPKKLSRGNEYVIVGYHFDANCILATPIRNKKGATIADGWRTLHNDFKKVGVAPSTYVLDNEVSKDLIEGFEEERIMYQLVMPYKHRNN